MKMVRGILGTRGLSLWVFIAGFYFFAQAALYAQDRQNSAQQTADTPWEHLTLEAALVVAVGVQYRENRQKEVAATKMATDAAGAIARATEIMENVTEALERLTGKVEQCPIRVVGYQQRPPG